MHYKTMVLRLLERQPELHEPLSLQDGMLATLNRLAQELKARHEYWTEQLSQGSPTGNPSQVQGEALEISLEELHQRLSFTQDGETVQLTLADAMNFLRRHTPHA